MISVNALVAPTGQEVPDLEKLDLAVLDFSALEKDIRDGVRSMVAGRLAAYGRTPTEDEKQAALARLESDIQRILPRSDDDVRERLKDAFANRNGHGAPEKNGALSPPAAAIPGNGRTSSWNLFARFFPQPEGSNGTAKKKVQKDPFKDVVSEVTERENFFHALGNTAKTRELWRKLRAPPGVNGTHGTMSS